MPAHAHATLATPETHKFDAEVDKIFHLVIHALYEKKDIFLRELISNASDACDKLRYKAISKPELIADNPHFRITLQADAEAKTLTISDNGTGMTKQELVDNLGTIARSGTQNFIKRMTGDSKKDAQLIGQFGVGFYSSFMVANNVRVISRAAGQKKTHIWESEGKNSYTVREAEEIRPERGTTIILEMQDDALEFLDRYRLEHIVQTYSNHIGFDIFLANKDGTEIKLNEGTALWQKPKSEIAPEQYTEFYRAISHLTQDEPWLTLHTKAEGQISYTSLLFVPSAKPFNLYHPDRLTEVKLYIKRVFIADNALEIIPRWLRFLRGVVDAEDLPLNISRETIQNNRTVFKIRQSLIKKVLAELGKKSESEPENYEKFWANFGAVIKEGLCDQFERRDDVLEICRFRSTASGDKTTSLKDYAVRMKPEQKAIYFITGEADSIASSPQLEGFKKRGIEVLLLTDSVDQFWVNVLHSYKEIDLKSVTQTDGTAFAEKPEQGDAAEQAAPETAEPAHIGAHNAGELLVFILNTLGDAAVRDVRTTRILTESPVCLSVPEGGMDIRLERFMYENKQLAKISPKILQVNPEHPIILKMADDLAAGADKAKLADTAHLLFAIANVAAGEPIPDIAGFTRRMNGLLGG